MNTSNGLLISTGGARRLVINGKIYWRTIYREDGRDKRRWSQSAYGLAVHHANGWKFTPMNNVKI